MCNLAPAVLSLMEWLAARMHYGRDKAAFTWREQQHGAKQVRQRLDVSQPEEGQKKRTRRVTEMHFKPMV